MARMMVNTIFGRYIAFSYLVNMLVLLCAFLGIIFLFESIELIRRAAGHPDVSMPLIMTMAFFKLPQSVHVLLPFAILFSAMFSFWQLTRRYELIVARASGFSVWQFLAPVGLVAVAIGLFQMMVFNPVGAVMVSQYEDLENTYLERQENQIALFKEGLWLRQSIQSGYVIMYAEKVSQPGWILRNVMVLAFNDGDQLKARIQAKTAVLRPGRWELGDALLFAGKNKPSQHGAYAIPTQLTIADVEESFSSPAALSFWHLPSQIRTLEETGLDASHLRVHYHSLLAQPLMFIAMILLGAAVSMHSPRSRGTFLLILGGSCIGFVTFFLSSFLQALGATQQIPAFMAAWSPAVIGTLLGLSAMMTLEDG